MGVKKAVIDIGSNSILLLVAEKTDQGWKTLRQWSKVTALGQGTKQTGLLSDESIQNTLFGLKEAFDIACSAGAIDVVAYATMAARMAKNTSDFLSQAEKQKTPFFVLSGENEAKFGFLSIAEHPSYASSESLCTIDIGAQSTEVVIGYKEGENWKIDFLHSFSIGGWGVRDEYFPTAPVPRDKIFKASQSLDDLINVFSYSNSSSKLVSLGASGVNLVQIRDDIEEWSFREQEKILSYEEVSRAVGWLCSISDEERGLIKGVETGREKTIHSSALILERFMYALKQEHCYVSNIGWRYALLDHSPNEKVLI